MIVPFYAALLALLFIGLSIRTIRLRHRLKIGLGTGDSPALLRATRAHANFAEYVPLALLLLCLLEAQGLGVVWLHSLGGFLLLGRLVHAYGVSQVHEQLLFRVAGMALTFIVLLSAAVILLWINVVGH